MSKAQLTTALRRSFGDQVIQSESAISKLFDSFDFGRTDEMDWRAFLYMLTTLMQPYLYCDALMRYERCFFMRSSPFNLVFSATIPQFFLYPLCLIIQSIYKNQRMIPMRHHF